MMWYVEHGRLAASVRLLLGVLNLLLIYGAGGVFATRAWVHSACKLVWSAR